VVDCIVCNAEPSQYSLLAARYVLSLDDVKVETAYRDKEHNHCAREPSKAALVVAWKFFLERAATITSCFSTTRMTGNGSGKQRIGIATGDYQMIFSNK
jgi:hypothetical protein